MRHDFGPAMLEARKGRGYSRAQLARISGVSQSNIRQYETGVVVPSVSAVVALADALMMSVDGYIGHSRRSITGEVRTDG